MPTNIEDDNLDNESLDPIEYEEHGETSFNDQQKNNTSPNDSQTSINQPKNASPTFLARLSQLPIQRSLPWREGQELPPERSTASSRVQQRGACLLATRGIINDNSCNHCKAGRGRFTDCIVLGNWFQGACANCVFTSKGNRCSSRLERGYDDGRVAKHQLAGDGGMVEERKPTSKKRKRWAPATNPAIVDIINKTLDQSSAQVSEGASWPTTNKIPCPGPAQPSATAAFPQTMSPDMDSLLQAELAREQSTGLLGYVQDMEKKQKQHHDINALLEISNDRLLRYDEPPRRKSHMQAYNCHPRPSKVPSTRLNAGPAPSPPPQDLSVQSKRPEISMTGAAARPQDDGTQPISFIDTLPKSKQLQIFELISGIQGGIDHLQKQLSLLRSTLGIETEDSKVERGS